MLIAVFTVFALKLMFTYAPLMETFFHTRSLPTLLGAQMVGIVR